jgi:hypothetical protein
VRAIVPTKRPAARVPPNPTANECFATPLRQPGGLFADGKLTEAGSPFPLIWLEAFARGGAGGIYGDILGAALHGGRGGLNLAAQMAGPIPGFVGDLAELATSPMRQALDDSGRQTFSQQALAIGKRWTPTTWYAKLSVDRLWWDKLQTLVDPDYRGSFRRLEQRTRNNSGQSFWWGPGRTPERGPDLSAAFK